MVTNIWGKYPGGLLGEIFQHEVNFLQWNEWGID